MTELKAEFDAEVNELLMNDGDYVDAGDLIIVLSVCKMLQHLTSPATGTIKYSTTAGAYVKQGDVLARIE